MLIFNSNAADEKRQEDNSADNLKTAMADSIPMQVLVFSSQKGGSGKTTLCGQLAVQAELSGSGPVAVVDADPQGSLADWWNERKSDTPVFVKTSVEDLRDDLRELRLNGIRLVFVDTPPAVTDTIEQIVAHADLVVVPTRPSPHDLRAVGATLDIIECQDKPLIFCVNGATARARITSETAIALSQHGTVAPITVHHRNDFATSMVKGGTVMEANPESRSAKEIVELWKYIASRLGKVERRVQQVQFDGIDRRHPAKGKEFGEVSRTATFGRRVSDRQTPQQPAPELAPESTQEPSHGGLQQDLNQDAGDDPVRKNPFISVGE